MKASGVYQIRNTISGSCYIGSAINIDQRWKSHRSSLGHNKKSPPKLQRAWDKYGEEAFEFSVILICSRVDLLLYEQRCIDAHQPRYNTRAQAKSNIGIKWSRETNMAKGRGVQFEVCGVTGTIHALARHFGVVTAQTVKQRLDLGCSIDDAVTRPPMGVKERGIKSAQTRAAAGGSYLGRAIKYKGVTASLSDHVKAYSPVGYRTVLARLTRGWGFDRALLTPNGEVSRGRIGLSNKKSVPITVLGFTGNQRMIAEHFGVPLGVLESRLRRLGWGVEKAVTTPVRCMNKKGQNEL